MIAEALPRLVEARAARLRASGLDSGSGSSARARQEPPPLPQAQLLLPPPLFTKRAGAHSSDDAPWRCQMCDWIGCRHLLPLAGSARGFRMVSGGGTHVHDGQVAKFGWLAQHAGDSIAFAVDGGRHGARVQLAMLCSHFGVGSATVELYRAPSSPRVALARTSSQTVAAGWKQRTSQQCIVPLGTIEAGAHVLRVEVQQPPLMSNQAAVGMKIFGLQVQML